MTAISSPNYRWRVGEVEITHVLEFEAALALARSEEFDAYQMLGEHRRMPA